MTRHYICSRIAGDVIANCERAIAFAEKIRKEHGGTCVTFAFRAILDGWLSEDNSRERQVGHRIDAMLLRQCDDIRVNEICIEGCSSGMLMEIKCAEYVGIPVFFDGE